MHPITVGVPQGSALAPILSNLYTADIPTHPHTTTATFVDNTAIFALSQNYRFAHLYTQQHSLKNGLPDDV